MPRNLCDTNVRRSQWIVKIVAAVTQLAVLLAVPAMADEQPKAFIDGTGPDWKALAEEDFVNVNCDPDTWSWRDGILSCTGKPTGVLRTQNEYKNFEFVAQWMHVNSGGNSGIFVWAAADATKNLKAGERPRAIEVQILDHGFTKQYEASTGNKGDWFTTDGDIFPVFGAKMKPFAPVSPRGDRSFPRKQLTKGFGEWNHYYVRCINGEVRLWVNGEEVSGGSDCEPRSGFICLEAEGSPALFKEMRVRSLP